MKIVGTNAEDALDHFTQSEMPTSYLGITANILPNLFFILGPNTVTKEDLRLMPARVNF